MKKEMHEFVTTLIYDSLGWTPIDKITTEGIAEVRKGLKLLLKEEITSEEFMKLRHGLLMSGMATMPHDYRE